MALAMEREQTTYSSLLMVAGTALADPEPMLARLIRGCIALAFTATVPADQSSQRHADTCNHNHNHNHECNHNHDYNPKP